MISVISQSDPCTLEAFPDMVECKNPQPLEEKVQLLLKPEMQQARRSQISNVKAMYEDIYLILFPKQLASVKCSRSVVITALKVGAIIACYVASVPFIKPAEQVVNQFVLQKFFAAGEFIAWGTLSAWSACKLIDRMSKKRQVHSNMFCTALYWTPLIALGVLSETPDAYITYKYNQNIFWSVYTPLVYSFFSILSLDALVQKISHTNNFLTRYLYRHTQKPAIFQTKENFLNLLQHCLTGILKDKNSPFKNELLDLAFSSSLTETNQRKCKRALLKLLKFSLEARIRYLETQPCWVKIGDQVAQVVGSVCSLITSGVDGYIVYSAGKMFLDNDAIIALMIILAIGPSAYLNADINRQTYSSSFCSLINIELNKNCARQLPNRIGYILAIIITAFGLGSLATVMRDTFGITEWWAIILFVIVIVSSGILTKYAMGEFSDSAIETLHILKTKGREKELAEFNTRIRNLIERFEDMPAEAFAEFLIKLKIAGVTMQQTNLLVKQLKESPEMHELIEKIDIKMKRIEANKPISERR